MTSMAEKAKRRNRFTNLPNRDKIIVITKSKEHKPISQKINGRSSRERKEQGPKKRGKSKNLLLLASEMPNPPTHILEPGAPLARVASGDDLQPCPMKVRFIDAANHFLDEVFRRIEMASIAQIRRRGLLFFNGGRTSVQYRFQIAINPLVPSHFSNRTLERRYQNRRFF